jgi:GNAT superfamily N-acetyltransferase
LAQNLRTALCLGTVFLEDRLVGVGAVKRLSAHHSTIVRRTGFKDLVSFSAEIGYFFVDPTCRGNGLAGNLFNALLSRSPGAVYATTREDNEAMQRILTKNGFTRAGQPWDSRQSPGKRIHLWVGPRRDCRQNSDATKSSRLQYLLKVILYFFSAEDHPAVARSDCPHSPLSRCPSRFDSHFGS